MKLEEYKKLSTEDRLNFLKKKYKEEIEGLIKDFQNNASYLYLEYDYYKDKTEKQLENYLLKTVDGFLTTKEDTNGFSPKSLTYQGWKILKEDGFTSCFLEASAYGYEDYDALEDPEDEEDEDYDDYEDDVDESNYDPYTGGPVWESQKAWKDNNMLRESLNSAQRELLNIIKDNLDDYDIDDPTDIADLIYNEWDNSNILIPTSFAKKYGEDPENISQELVDRYFDERINTPEFVERVRELFNF